MTGCGAILVQEGWPVSYFSSKFSGAEINYTTTEQEMLGVIKALKAWRCYLEGGKGLTLITDHNPLTFLPTQHLLSRGQARWNEFMSRFHYVWKHTPGKLNPADPLSRLGPSLSVQTGILSTMLEIPHDFASKIPEGYNLDPRFADKEFIKKYGLELSHGLWNRGHQVAVPASLTQAAIQAHHDSLQGGHFGITKTLELISRTFWWPSLKIDVTQHINSCPQCQRNKGSTTKPYGLLQPLSIPDSRWEVVSLDFTTGLPRTRSGHDSILVFVD
jgi:hypothetical protein